MVLAHMRNIVNTAPNHMLTVFKNDSLVFWLWTRKDVLKVVCVTCGVLIVFSIVPSLIVV